MSNQRIRQLTQKKAALTSEIAAKTLILKPEVQAEMTETFLDHQEELHQRFDEVTRVTLRSEDFFKTTKRMILACVEDAVTRVTSDPEWQKKLGEIVTAEIDKQFDPLVAQVVKTALDEKLKKLLADLKGRG